MANEKQFDWQGKSNATIGESKRSMKESCVDACRGRIRMDVVLGWGLHHLLALVSPFFFTWDGLVVAMIIL
jgi:hypothetical protein